MVNWLFKVVVFFGIGVVIIDEEFEVKYVNLKMVEMIGFEECYFIGFFLLSIIL